MQVSAKPSKQRTEVRQASLVEAALRLAAQRSPADISTTDLAQAVGITQGAVFRHFANKEAIWLAALDWVTDTLMNRLHRAAQTALGELPAPADSLPASPALVPEAPVNTHALAALQAVFMAHVNFVVEHPGVPRVIFQELQRPGDTALKARVRSLMQQYRQLVAQLLAQAKATNKIALQADLTSATVLFIGSIQGLVMQSLMSGDVAAMTRQAPGVYALFQRGLLAQAPL
ncbi:TetR family transcriptional regulator [Rhodoferax sp.]|uniref:TetR/AcrR family transcriptional regulator n=1 Tax=Rhodoferax sp. TaxID=50421 RepID=UPI002624C90A|nr:TetR family transcriptional regulator [Rhodoferax sp.]MDD2924731.1 TetR family transcriptional regulator [Rhodoferax sp.]